MIVECCVEIEEIIKQIEALIFNLSYEDEEIEVRDLRAALSNLRRQYNVLSTSEQYEKEVEG
jgi:hypothetical protein